MAHISSKKLNSAVEKELHAQLLRVTTVYRGRQILNELLTDTERVMLAEEIPYYRIRQILGVSISTTQRLHAAYEKGVYREIETLVARKKERENFWSAMEVALRMGLPPQGGGGGNILILTRKVRVDSYAQSLNMYRYIDIY